MFLLRILFLMNSLVVLTSKRQRDNNNTINYFKSNNPIWKVSRDLSISLYGLKSMIVYSAFWHIDFNSYHNKTTNQVNAGEIIYTNLWGFKRRTWPLQVLLDIPLEWISHLYFKHNLPVLNSNHAANIFIFGCFNTQPKFKLAKILV